MAVNSRWWTKETVAVVTGANKDIGFEIVRQFAENGLTVILTARDANRGLDAVKTLHDQGFHNVVFRELDIQKPYSISEFGGWIKDNYGGLDILVNNAAIYGMILDYEALMNALQVSRVYDLIYLKNDSLRRQLSDGSIITEELIDNMLEMFLEDMKRGEVEGKGWPIFSAPYSLSKIALNAHARLLAEKFSKSEQVRRIYVNCVHPGSVKTDMSENRGSLTASQGAESCVMVALLPPAGSSGQFYYLKERHEF